MMGRADTLPIRLLKVLGGNLAVMAFFYLPDFAKDHLITHLGGPMAMTGLGEAICLPPANMVFAIFLLIRGAMIPAERQSLGQWATAFFLAGALMILLAPAGCFGMMALEPHLPGATYGG